MIIIIQNVGYSPRKWLLKYLNITDAYCWEFFGGKISISSGVLEHLLETFFVKMWHKFPKSFKSRDWSGQFLNKTKKNWTKKIAFCVSVIWGLVLLEKHRMNSKKNGHAASKLQCSKRIHLVFDKKNQFFAPLELMQPHYFKIFDGIFWNFNMYLR